MWCSTSVRVPDAGFRRDHPLTAGRRCRRARSRSTSRSRRPAWPRRPCSPGRRCCGRSRRAGSWCPAGARNVQPAPSSTFTVRLATTVPRLTRWSGRTSSDRPRRDREARQIGRRLARAVVRLDGPGVVAAVAPATLQETTSYVPAVRTPGESAAGRRPAPPAMQHPCASIQPTLARQRSCATRDWPLALGSGPHGRWYRHAQANAPVRPPRRGRREARSVRRLGDAGPVRGHPGGAPRGAREGRDLRRLAHGRDRVHRPRRRGVPAADPLQRRGEDRRERSAVLRPHQGGRRSPRRPLQLQARARPLPHRDQRRQPREGSRVVPAPRRGLRRDAP